MAGSSKNGVNGAMAEQKESSVLFSLKELMTLEETRIKEEEDARKRRAEQEVQARLDAERRARDDEEARLRGEEERRRQDELRRKMEEAQIEAARAAELEKRTLEEQHRLQMEALAKQQAHEKEIHLIQSQKRKGVHPGVMAAIGVALLAALVTVVFFVAIKPASDAKEAIKRAEIAAATDDPRQWDEADRQLAIARDKDPSNKDIVPVSDKVQKKREATRAAVEKERLAFEEKYKKLQADLLAAQESMREARTDAERRAAEEKIARASAAVRAVGPAPKAPEVKKICPPGVPLCN